FQDLAAAEHWGPIPDDLSGIRINFGHFGLGKTIQIKQQQRLAGYMDDANGRSLYADSADFSEGLTQPALVKSLLSKLYKETSGKGDAALAQRLMYGTDWEMVVREGPPSEQYLRKFEDIFDSLSPDGKLSDRFFGMNAAEYLGLHVGQPNRRRLDRY